MFVIIRQHELELAKNAIMYGCVPSGRQLGELQS